ncbi:MAG: sulfite exporter TauE/SafE family protein [Sphingomonadaceae bacterium]|nr:sulfite exporter TauE/SafE family protein [Sphingomonadaceae bacterium]
MVPVRRHCRDHLSYCPASADAGWVSLPTDPIFYSVAAIAVILVGVAKGGFAGLGAAAMPILVLVMDPAPAAAMLLPILIAQDIVSVWAFRRDFDVATLKLMLPGGLVGVFLGWLFATAVPVEAVRGLVGMIAIVFGIVGNKALKKL